MTKEPTIDLANQSFGACPVQREIITITIIIIIKSENVRKTFHGLTLIFPESVESASLAAKYGYDEWLVSRFLEYVPRMEDFLPKMKRPPTQ